MPSGCSRVKVLCHTRPVPPTEPRLPLDRARIVRTALQLLDETGLDGLTLRVLADRLGVKAPALYWHIPSKGALLDEMATTMLRDLLDSSRPVEDDIAWPALLRTSADGLHRMLLGHRDGARVFSGTYLTDDSAVASSEIPMRILTAAGFSLQRAAWAWQTLVSFVIGFTIEEQAVEPTPGRRDARFDPATRAARLETSDAPLAAAAGEHMFGEASQRFEFGVQVVIDGLAAHRSTN